MAGSVAENRPQKDGPTSTRWLLIRAGSGRVGRWAVFSVLLAAVPILTSFIFLPKNSSVTSLLSHGDFAILAAALVAAAMGELCGPDEPIRWVRNILISSCVVLFSFTIVLLSGIAGNAPHLSPIMDVRYSWMSFGVAVIVGAASWAFTINRFMVRGQAVPSTGSGEIEGNPG